MVPKWNAWTQSSTPHSPAAGYLLSRGRALMHDRLLENTEEYVVRNVETYHQQFRPLYRYAGKLQDNGMTPQPQRVRKETIRATNSAFHMASKKTPA
jgi:hypothetical protein